MTIFEFFKWLLEEKHTAKNIKWVLPKYVKKFKTREDILHYIAFNIKYESDQELHGQQQYEQTPNETLWLNAGDCEDFAILQSCIEYYIAQDHTGYIAYFSKYKQYGERDKLTGVAIKTPTEGHAIYTWEETPGTVSYQSNGAVYHGFKDYEEIAKLYGEGWKFVRRESSEECFERMCVIEKKRYGNNMMEIKK